MAFGVVRGPVTTVSADFARLKSGRMSAETVVTDPRSLFFFCVLCFVFLTRQRVCMFGAAYFWIVVNGN